eukprot:PhF_6_TR1058/c1_g1_i2/m.2216
MDDSLASDIYGAYHTTPIPTVSMLVLSFSRDEDMELHSLRIPFDTILLVYQYACKREDKTPLGVAVVGTPGAGSTTIMGLLKAFTMSPMERSNMRKRAVEAGKLGQMYSEQYRGRYLHSSDGALCGIFVESSTWAQTRLSRDRDIVLLLGPSMAVSPKLHIRTLFMADTAVVCVPIPHDVKPFQGWDLQQLLLRCFASGMRWIVVAVTFMDAVRWDVTVFEQFATTTILPMLVRSGFPRHRVVIVPTGRNMDLPETFNNVMDPWDTTHPSGSLIESLQRMYRMRHPCEDGDAPWRFQCHNSERIRGIGTTVLGRVLSGTIDCPASNSVCSPANMIKPSGRLGFYPSSKTNIANMTPPVANDHREFPMKSFEVFHESTATLTYGQYAGITRGKGSFREIPIGAVFTLPRLHRVVETSLHWYIVRLLNVSKNFTLKPPRRRIHFHSGALHAPCTLHRVVTSYGGSSGGKPPGPNDTVACKALTSHQMFAPSPTTVVAPKQYADVLIRFDAYVPLETFEECAKLSRFLMREGYEVIALGTVVRKISLDEVPKKFEKITYPL